MKSGTIKVHPIVIVPKVDRVKIGDQLVRRSYFVDKATGVSPKPGDIFYHARSWIDETMRRALSPEYLRARAVRERYPVVLVLPDGVWWAIDQRAFSREHGAYGNGWTVYHIPPLSAITVRPSIRTDRYHGVLSHGLLVPQPDSQT